MVHTFPTPLRNSVGVGDCTVHKPMNECTNIFNEFIELVCFCIWISIYEHWQCVMRNKRKIIVQLNLVFCLHNVIKQPGCNQHFEVPKFDCTNLKLNWIGLLTRCFLLCQSRLKRNICHSQTLEQIIFGINPCYQIQLSQIIIDSVQFNSSYIRIASVLIIIVCRFLIGHWQPGP